MQVPSWPSGHVKLDGDVLEFGPELDRVRVADLKKIEVGKAKLGRLSLKLQYQSGLNKVKTSVWVEEAHAAELGDLVAAVQGQM